MDGTQRVALVETRTEGSEPGVLRRVVRYQLGNHLGSAVLELTDAAAIISYEEFSPGGCTLYLATRGDTEAPKRYRFTGKERDEESGFSYHGARYYAPWLSRWTATDPIGIAGGLNLYAYASCNPSRLVDSSGMWPHQWELIQQTELRQAVTATAKGRGITPETRGAYQALARQWQYAGGKVDVGHEKSFALTRAGETGGTFVEPRHGPGGNRSKAAQEKAAAAKARANNEFARTTKGADPTAEPGTRYGQPQELPKLQGVRESPEPFSRPMGKPVQFELPFSQAPPSSSTAPEPVQLTFSQAPTVTAAEPAPTAPAETPAPPPALTSTPDPVPAASPASPAATGEPAGSASQPTPVESPSPLGGVTGALGGTLLGLSAIGTIFQYFEFDQFIRDMGEKGFGSFSGIFQSNEVDASDALRSLPPGTQVEIHTPFGKTFTVETGRSGTYGVNYL